MFVVSKEVRAISTNGSLGVWFSLSVLALYEVSLSLKQ